MAALASTAAETEKTGFFRFIVLILSLVTVRTLVVETSQSFR